MSNLNNMVRIAALIVASSACGVEVANAQSCTFNSNNKVNQLTIATPNSFAFGSALWISGTDYSQSTPKTNYTFAVQATPGSGWKTTGQVNNSVTQSFSGSGRMMVTNVEFEHQHLDPSGKPDYMEYDNAQAYVFVFNVALSFVNTGHLPAQSEYNKHDAFTAKAGTDLLGPLPPAQSKGYIAGTMEIMGVVSPYGLGYKPGGAPMPFVARRTIVSSRSYVNGAVDPGDNGNFDGTDDSLQSPVSGSPTKALSAIYDADAPGISQSASDPVGTTLERIVNFQEWWEYNSIQCSPKKLWHIKVIAKKTTSGYTLQPGSEVAEGNIPTNP